MASTNRSRARKRTHMMPVPHIKVFVAKRIRTIIKERGITQTDAARLMRTAPSQVSLITTLTLRGFSLERLLSGLAGLGDNIILQTVPNGKKGTVRAWTDA